MLQQKKREEKREERKRKIKIGKIIESERGRMDVKKDKAKRI